VPRLTKKHLEPLQYPELRLVAMLGMGMDINLAYSGDTDNVFKWICTNQDKLTAVDLAKIAAPKKPGRPGPLRGEAMIYLQGIQQYLSGDVKSPPNWAGLVCGSTSELLTPAENLPTEEQDKMTVEAVCTIGDYPKEWLTKAGTPDKRKAVVRAVLNGDMSLDEAIQKERDKDMKYIQKTGAVPEQASATPEFAEPPVTEDAEKPSYVTIPSFSAPAEVAETAAEPAPAPRKAVFKKKSISKKAASAPEDGVGDDVKSGIFVMKDRLDYISSAISEIKQTGFERNQQLTEEVLELKNAVLFIVNSVVIDGDPLSDLSEIPTPDEY
jgi:hypothetical protein